MEKHLGISSIPGELFPFRRGCVCVFVELRNQNIFKKYNYFKVLALWLCWILHL